MNCGLPVEQENVRCLGVPLSVDDRTHWQNKCTTIWGWGGSDFQLDPANPSGGGRVAQLLSYGLAAFLGLLAWLTHFGQVLP